MDRVAGLGGKEGETGTSVPGSSLCRHGVSGGLWDQACCRGCPQGAERGKEICGSLSLIIFMFSCLITTCQLSVGRNDVLWPLVWEFIVINGPGGND